MPNVPPPPETAQERLHYLVALAQVACAPFVEEGEADDRVAERIRERMAQAAQVWTLEVDELREMLASAHTEVAELRARKAQLEEALAKAGDDLTALEVRLDDERQRASAEAQRHAVEMGEMRSALLHLCAQLAREIRRGGGA